MIRISTTTLESYRRVLTTEYATEAELIAQVKGEPFEPSWQMQAGSAWQALLSSPFEVGTIDETQGEYRVHYGDFSFGRKSQELARDHIGPGISEVKALARFQLGCRDAVPVDVVAQVDHIRGLMIQENKAKFSTPDARDYEQSLQWRFYLLAHEAAHVRYNLFDFADPKNGYCELRNIVSFGFWTYPDLRADCERWVRAFLEWASSKRLLSYLGREGSTPMAA